MTGSEPTPRTFEFGKNWAAFLPTIDERRIDSAKASMMSMLGASRLDQQTFLDIGCGSGLSSLAAVRLGATVHSFDADPRCIAVTRELKHRFAPHSEDWIIEHGSAIDETYLTKLDRYDIVYSWGVLHHTGIMDKGINLAADRVVPGGKLFIAIYNDQGRASQRWTGIKQTYQRLPNPLRLGWVGIIASYYELKFAAARAYQGRNPLPFSDWKRKTEDRGMSVWHDWVDWIGGWPFETATPHKVIDRMQTRGFVLEKMKSVGNGWGCNEFVFRHAQDLKSS